MDVSYSSRATTSWPDDNCGATSDDSDYYYAELEKRMLQLMREDDDEDYKSLVESNPNPGGSYRENYSMPAALSFPIVARPTQGDFDRMKNNVSFPKWQLPLPANGYGIESGSGTGVFIPLPSKRMVPDAGKAKGSKSRMYKRSEESTNN